MAKYIGKKIDQFVYIDLESPRDLLKLEDPEFFFESNAGKTVCLDEIQRKPDLFPALRSFVDRDTQKTRIILLGSASPELSKHSSETLAGRISYISLSPFTISEISSLKTFTLQNFWLNGGFPLSYLHPTMSFRWIENFIRTFIERDIPQIGFNTPSPNLKRFLMMIAHSCGQIINTSKIGESLGVSHTTVRKYIDIMEQAFLLRTVPPYYKNVKKRIVKSPKVYIRDTGILHTLLSLKDFNELIGHPIYGQSWESFCIENIISELPDWDYFFYRTSNGAELDLVMERGVNRIGLEFKVSTAPQIPKGFWNCIDDLEIREAWVITPLEKQYQVRNNVSVCGLQGFLERNFTRKKS